MIITFNINTIDVNSSNPERIIIILILLKSFTGLSSLAIAKV